jgi:hypothetical protein
MKALGLKYRLGLPRITGPENFGLMEGWTGLRVSPSFTGPIGVICGILDSIRHLRETIVCFVVMDRLTFVRQQSLFHSYPEAADPYL